MSHWRFAGKVKANGNCVEWTGCRNVAKNGHSNYGRVSVAGRLVLAHRLAWEIANGPIPDGALVLHSCDNPPCVNVLHLRLGTQSDNAKDAARKGRWNSPNNAGERHGQHKLTLEQARAIKRSSESMASLASRYGVCREIVRRIKRGMAWKEAQ